MFAKKIKSLLIWFYTQLTIYFGEKMDNSRGGIQKIKEQYSTWQHALFWLGIVLNFFVFYQLITSLSYVGWPMPVVQALYLAMCFKAYKKGSNAVYIIVPLFIVSAVMYLSLGTMG